MALPYRIKDHAVQGNFDALSGVGKWTPVSFSTNWRNLVGDAANYGVNVTKDVRGMVNARGIAERTGTSFSFGTAGSSAQIGTIPPAFRPKRIQYLMTWCHEPSGNNSPVRVLVEPGGALYVDSQLGGGTIAGTGGPVGAYIVLDGLTWPTF